MDIPFYLQPKATELKKRGELLAEEIEVAEICTKNYTTGEFR